jgi:hypothetical protein
MRSFLVLARHMFVSAIPPSGQMVEAGVSLRLHHHSKNPLTHQWVFHF